MSKTRPKDIGTATESAVVKYLRANGWPKAIRLVLQGKNDIGDISLGEDYRVVIEVKGGHAAENASDGQVQKWLEETNRERLNGKAEMGMLVMKRKGVGASNAGNWWVVMEAWQYDLLRGKPPHDVFDDINPHLHVRFTLDHATQCLRAAGMWDGVAFSNP